MEESTNSNEKAIICDAKDGSTDSVVVYNDRAEVTRKLSVDVKKGNPHLRLTILGPQEIIVRGFTTSIEDSSIRVSGLGNATILEVATTQINPIPKKVNQKEIDAALKPLLEKKVRYQKELQRIQEELKWLSKYSSEATKARETDGKLALSLDDAEKFLQFYSVQYKRIDDRELEVSNQVSELDKQIAEISNTKTEEKTEPYKEVSILLNVEKDGKVELRVSYVLAGAQWMPSYDVRVNTKDNTMQLVYYGQITNNTKELWKEAKMSLSTAQPAISGHPPDLRTLRVYFQGKTKLQRKYSTARNRLDIPTASLSVNPLWYANDLGDSSTPVAMETAVSSVSQSAVSATFSIPRVATIASDNKPHKVTIAILDMKSQFTYTVIPKLAQRAYLRANCTNNSEYVFLAGEMNVFIDSAFVSKSSLKTTNPKEEVSLFLGVDNSVVVDFKESTFLENKGVISKVKTTNYYHNTTIKNTKGIPIEVSLFDQLPLSTDDKVKVVLVKPTINEKTIILNEFNNVRWILKLEAGATQAIEYHYTIEHAHDAEVDIS